MAATEFHPMALVAPGQLEVVVTAQGTTTTIALGGEWDLAAGLEIRQTIRSVFASPPECVVLDLGELTFIDSSAVHVILGLQKRCAQQHVRFVIAPGCRAVQRPFEILGLIPGLPFLAGTAWR